MPRTKSTDSEVSNWTSLSRTPSMVTALTAGLQTLSSGDGGTDVSEGKAGEGRQREVGRVEFSSLEGEGLLWGPACVGLTPCIWGACMGSVGQLSMLGVSGSAQHAWDAWLHD